ncbi:MAG: hypothetical protein MUC92_04590 [Fimbriimonadaceae bacterium]|nr:hypothetical protein [Fimbriimonadaceae bacterium]
MVDKKIPQRHAPVPLGIRESEPQSVFLLWSLLLAGPVVGRYPSLGDQVGAVAFEGEDENQSRRLGESLAHGILAQVPEVAPLCLWKVTFHEARALCREAGLPVLFIFMESKPKPEVFHLV